MCIPPPKKINEALFTIKTSRKLKTARLSFVSVFSPFTRFSFRFISFLLFFFYSPSTFLLSHILSQLFPLYCFPRGCYRVEMNRRKLKIITCVPLFTTYKTLIQGRNATLISPSFFMVLLLLQSWANVLGPNFSMPTRYARHCNYLFQSSLILLGCAVGVTA